MTVTTVTGAGQPFPTGTAAAARESFAPQETLTADELITLTTANRQSSARGYPTYPPLHFAVTYAINPWMRRSSGRAGSEPIGVDLSELHKAAGGPKCCTLELRGQGAQCAHGAHGRTQRAWGPADQAWPERSQTSSIIRSSPRRRIT